MISTLARRTGLLLAMAWLPLVLIALWIWSSNEGASLFYPRTALIWDSFREHFLSREVGTFLGPSLRNLALGFLIAAVLGVLFGVMLGLGPRAAAFFSWPIDFFRSLPGPALLPLFMVLFGIGTSMKVSIIAFTALFPILLSTIDGVRSCDPRWSDVCRAYHVGAVRQFCSVVLPGAAPQIAAGLRVGLQTSLLLMVVSEMIASTGGLGFLILQSQQSFRIADMWAGIVMLGLLGFLLNLAFDPVERWVLRWHTAALAQFKN